MPAARAAAIRNYLDDQTVSYEMMRTLAATYQGASFGELERAMMRARRIAAIQDTSTDNALISVARDRFQRMPASERGQLAVMLMRHVGISQRKAHEITGVSRDTLRKYASMQDSTNAETKEK